MFTLRNLSFLVLLLPVRALALPPDTSINGIRVEFEYSLSIFPASWQGAPVYAKGEVISATEIPRSKTIIAEALNKYPAFMLKKDLTNVYFLRSMRFFDAPYGGTNSTGAIYISNNGEKAGYTDYYLEQTFHHELSSIFFRNHAALLDTIEWKKSNIPAFDYNDPENGVGLIRKNQTSQEIDTLLCRQGFLTEYSLSSMENDINTYAQNLFRPSGQFWQVAGEYARIGSKVRLLIAFYNKIDPFFTEAYFRKFQSK